MNKLEKMRLFLASCMMGMAVSIVSCSSENGENDILDGKGTIRLGMSTGVDFGVTTTRSVNLADYQDKNNYTVQILKSDGTRLFMNSHTLICRQSPWNWITERIR